MQVTAFWLKWGLRFYPPLFFQRIWVCHISADFRSMAVKVNKSLLNVNYNRSIFGGTLFAAADPFVPVLFHQIFIKKGYKIAVWSKSAQVQFLKPGHTDMFFEINITNEDILEAEQIINANDGKYAKTFPINIRNKFGEVCVIVGIEVYIRNLNPLLP
ncbi:DUF4442 domain-containing protein [Mucilaginibacter sp. KACC 22063]|nr:DUF4442 domain-containing protein [Mucilaginibacter sp. KACC 22063]WDF53539.1 DUF4442 domain-containing protein [Mucilaginibacter sp. KACC 22063]